MNYDIFESYKKDAQPTKYYKSYAWKTAIGLQKVDGLEPSNYLIETARQNIDGEITFDEAYERIASYYKESNLSKEREQEADLVSVRIAQILSEKTFAFSPIEYITIHKRLFEGIYSHAGKVRDYNISKDEWVLNGDTVIYANAINLLKTLEYDFAEEKKFDYNRLSVEEIIEHVARFVSNLWQIHAFGEGNTRATAVFLIKYLNKLGFDLTNDIFAENAWYFRNALVRANYNNRAIDVFETTYYLELFMRNLLLGENNFLSNRELHVEYKKQCGVGKMSDRENAIRSMLKENPHITLQEVAIKVGKSLRTVKTDLKSMQERGVVKRLGGKKSGVWVVIEKNE